MLVINLIEVGSEKLEVRGWMLDFGDIIYFNVQLTISSLEHLTINV